MAYVHINHVKEHEEILVGPRGGVYVIRKGRQVTVTDKPITRDKHYKPKRGAYNRFTQHQMNAITGSTEMGNTTSRKRNRRDGQSVSSKKRKEHGDRSKAFTLSHQT
tara:strand:+ start:2213 stop:2533 length:321 start_codon:yes stop_codon:yes gene_type:complete